jgi:hypothetical protein
VWGEVSRSRFLKAFGSRVGGGREGGLRVIVQGFDGKAAEMVGPVQAVRDGGIAAIAQRYDCAPLDWSDRVAG